MRADVTAAACVGGEIGANGEAETPNVTVMSLCTR